MFDGLVVEYHELVKEKIMISCVGEVILVPDFAFPTLNIAFPRCPEPGASSLEPRSVNRSKSSARLLA